jgi:hypothetical protein
LESDTNKFLDQTEGIDMIVGVKLDSCFVDFIEEHSDQIQQTVNQIGDAVDGKEIGIGIISMQIAYFAIIKDLDQEGREGAIIAMRRFLEINKEPLNTTIQ